MKDKAVGVLGAGSWGTALAMQLARNGAPAFLWGRDAAQLAAMQTARSNARYLPGLSFPEQLHIETELPRLLQNCSDVLIAAPSSALRSVLQPLADTTHRVVWATKGFEDGSGKLPHEVAREVLGTSRPLAVLSGPSFAREVAADLPTAITLAATDKEFGEAFAARLHGGAFRVYNSDDVIGVEIGGAVKNVIAIGAGLADGLGFGANARAALITRGLAEIQRLGITLGGRPETFMGLAGMGDLVLTCTDDQSRNRRCGKLLAKGLSAAAAQTEIKQVVEGIAAARETRRVAARAGVDMPISEQIYRVLYENLAPRAAVEALLERERKME